MAPPKVLIDRQSSKMHRLVCPRVGEQTIDGKCLSRLAPLRDRTRPALEATSLVATSPGAHPEFGHLTQKRTTVPSCPSVLLACAEAWPDLRAWKHATRGDTLCSGWFVQLCGMLLASGMPCFAAWLAACFASLLLCCLDLCCFACFASLLLGSVAAWLGCAAWLRLVAWLRGCFAALLPGCLALLLGFIVAWLCGCLAFWLLGFVAAWLCGCLASAWWQCFSALPACFACFAACSALLGGRLDPTSPLLGGSVSSPRPQR